MPIDHMKTPFLCALFRQARHSLSVEDSKTVHNGRDAVIAYPRRYWVIQCDGSEELQALRETAQRP